MDDISLQFVIWTLEAFMPNFLPLVLILWFFTLLKVLFFMMTSTLRVKNIPNEKQDVWHTSI